MAKLGTPYPFPTLNLEREDWGATIEEQEKAFAKIPSDKIISFSVADGHAHYFVQSLSPLVLRWINYLDGYQIPYAYIRGLRRADVEQMIHAKIAFEKLWSKS